MAARIRLLAETMYVENLTIACETAEQFGSETFDQHILQFHLWLLISAAERRLSLLAQRRKRRSARWKRMRIVSGELKRSHLEAIEILKHTLERRIWIGKQIGDGLVWNLAKGDPRFVRPLFKPSSHQLPDSIATDGYFRILEAAANSDCYRVVLTDLTHCCGLGDVLIEGAGWPHPSPFEVKAKRQDDGSINCFLHGNSIALQEISGEMERFCEVFGQKLARGACFDERGERQKREVDKGTNEAFQRFVDTMKFDSPVVRRNWRSLEGVIARALAGRVGCDQPEPGIAYLAFQFGEIRPDRIEDSMWSALERHEIVQDRGDWALGWSYEVLDEDELSSQTLPYLLWKIPPLHRAALISGHVQLVSAYRRDVWAAAFRREQIVWETIDGAWKLAAHGHEIAFDRLDAERLVMGVAFGGVSPREVAEHAALMLLNPDRMMVQRYRSSKDEPLDWFYEIKPDGSKVRL